MRDRRRIMRRGAVLAGGIALALTAALALDRLEWPARAESPAPAKLAQGERSTGTWQGRDVPVVTLPDFREVAKRVIPAVVTVRSTKEVKGFQHPSIGGEEGPFGDFFERFFGRPGMPDEPFTQHGLGSGVIVSTDGYILTNNHVVAEVDKVEVVTSDGEVHTARVVGLDKQSDVAVLQVDSRLSVAIAIGDSDALEVGDYVLAVGNPFSERLGHTVTHGIVSAKSRTNLALADYEDFIQTDAAINPGNSGGALVNVAGELVGINTAIVSRSGGYQGVSFAIPINLARHVMDQLIKSGKVVRGYLGVGIQNLNRDLAESMGLDVREGVLVRQVSKDTPAERAGLERGDVIVGLAGAKIRDVGQLRNRIAAMAPGTDVELEVIRGKERRKFQLKLAELPPQEPGAESPAEEGEAKELLGLTVQPLTPDLAERLGYQGEKGVLVSEVRRSGAAAEAGIRQGDLIKEVDRKPVASIADFRSAVEAAGKGKVMLLYLRRGEESLYVTLRP